MFSAYYDIKTSGLMIPSRCPYHATHKPMIPKRDQSDTPHTI